MRPRSLKAHPSKAGLLFGLGVLAAAACHKDPVVTTRTVTAYTPAACAASPGAYAEYASYGDFDPPSPVQTGYPFSDVGQALPQVYDTTQAMVVTATGTPDAAGAAQITWEGWSPVAPAGDVNVLVTPAFASCPLTTPVGPGTGSVMAPVGGEQVLFVGGTGDPTPPTYVARLDTGAVTSLGSEDLQHLRAYATVTAFGPGALVAGGFDGGQVRPDAEVYSTALGGIDTSISISLSTARWKHGAVVLANGETLLVGGLGTQDASSVLGSMEIIDAALDRSIPEGLGTLKYPRASPTVLRLATGDILVAGGTDANGNPVDAIEWFNGDGTPSQKQLLSLAQGPGSAFTALEAGGALAVLTPPAGATPPFQNVYFIESAGFLDTPPPIAATVSAPVFFGGASGAPILWTGSTWLRWSPYQGSFDLLPELDDAAPDIGPATTSPDPGLAMWLDPASLALTLLRFDTTTAYSSLPLSALDQTTNETAPDSLVQLETDATGGLQLPAGSPAPAVFVTDRSYADVQVSVSTTTGVLPLVALRDDAGNEYDVGGIECPLPGGTSAGSITVVRRDTAVTFTLGSVTTPCQTGPTWATGARVSVGVRGLPTVPSTAKDFVVTRLGEP